MSPLYPKGLAKLKRKTHFSLSIVSMGLFFAGIMLVSGFFSIKEKFFKKKNPDKVDLSGKNIFTKDKNSNGNLPMIRIENLNKNFGKTLAVNNVSFQINSGESVALWGPNGAGKTTVLRCILGVIPFQGNVTINGYDIRTESKQAKYHIGFVPQEIIFHDNMTVKETLKFYEKLKKTGEHSSEKWLKLVGLEEHTSKTVKQLSGGMKQRLALAIALLADPPILLLDEPTANLDMKSREDFLSLLKDLKASGKTIIFSSHRLDEVIPFSNRIIIMDRGKVVAEASSKDIYKYIGKTSHLRIFMRDELIAPAVKLLKDDGFNVEKNGAGIKIKIDNDRKIIPINRLIKSGIEIDDFEYIIEN